MSKRTSKRPSFSDDDGYYPSTELERLAIRHSEKERLRAAAMLAGMANALMMIYLRLMIQPYQPQSTWLELYWNIIRFAANIEYTRFNAAFTIATLGTIANVMMVILPTLADTFWRFSAEFVVQNLQSTTVKYLAMEIAKRYESYIYKLDPEVAVVVELNVPRERESGITGLNTTNRPRYIIPEDRGRVRKMCTGGINKPVTFRKNTRIFAMHPHTFKWIDLSRTVQRGKMPRHLRTPCNIRQKATATAPMTCYEQQQYAHICAKSTLQSIAHRVVCEVQNMPNDEAWKRVEYLLSTNIRTLIPKVHHSSAYARIFEHYNERYERPRQVRMEQEWEYNDIYTVLEDDMKALENGLANLDDPKFWRTLPNNLAAYQMFGKSEGIKVHAGKQVKYVRSVQAASKAVVMTVGPEALAESSELAHATGHVAAVSGTQPIATAYATKVNRWEMGEMFSSFSETAQSWKEGCQWFKIDYGQFDMTNGAWTRVIARIFSDLLVDPNSIDHSDLVRRLRQRNKEYTFGYSIKPGHWLYAYGGDMSVMHSGETRTSVNNSEVNITITVCALHDYLARKGIVLEWDKIYEHLVFMVLGDDNAGAIRADHVGFISFLEKYVEALGFVPEAELCPTLNDVDFCSSMLTPARDVNTGRDGLVIVPFCGKLLAKLPMSKYALTETQRYAYGAAIAKCLLPSYRHIKFMRNWFLCMIERAERRGVTAWMPGEYRTKMKWMMGELGDKLLEETTATVHFLTQRYNITVKELRQLERYMATQVPIHTILDHPVLYKIHLKDVGVPTNACDSFDDIDQYLFRYDGVALY